MPFGGKLRADNRWVKLAEMLPWDFIEDIYAQSMSEENGAGAISARIAFGSLYIRENEKLTDERTLEHIAENSYMQYFLGLEEFRAEPLFDASMMVHFRKRFPAEKIEEINKRIFVRKDEPGDGGPDEGSGGGTPPEDAPNSGKLVPEFQQFQRGHHAAGERGTVQGHLRLLPRGSAGRSNISEPGQSGLPQGARHPSFRPEAGPARQGRGK